MQNLSDLWSIPVSGGYKEQDAHSIPRFEGSVFTAYPRNGSLTSWSTQFRNVTL